MKTLRNISLFLTIGLFITTACMDTDELITTGQTAPGPMVFSVPAGALTGTATPGIVQPSVDVAAARFSKATTTSANYVGGNVEVTVSLPAEFATIKVNLLATSGARQEKAVLTNSGGSAKWTAPLNTLGTSGANPANNTALTFEFISTSADGVTTSRVFQITPIP